GDIHDAGAGETEGFQRRIYSIRYGHARAMKRNRETVYDEPWMKPPPLGATGPPDSHAVPETYKVPPPLDDGGEEELHAPANLTVEKILHSVYSEPEHGASPMATQLESLIAYRRRVSTPQSI